MEIREKCSCGAEFRAIGELAEKLHKSWVRRHSCPDPEPTHRDIETSSTIGFSPDYTGTGLDIPAKEYDPWDE